MDNFHIDVTSEGKTHLELALKIAFGSYHKAVGYKVIPDKGLVLYWIPVDDMVPLPFKMDSDAIVPIVQGWLAEQDYGREPDHDGDNGQGWRVYCESWGHVNHQFEAFVAIQPAWAMYGK